MEVERGVETVVFMLRKPLKLFLSPRSPGQSRFGVCLIISFNQFTHPIDHLPTNLLIHLPFPINPSIHHSNPFIQKSTHASINPFGCVGQSWRFLGATRGRVTEGEFVLGALCSQRMPQRPKRLRLLLVILKLLAICDTLVAI